jgi:hypothetical protein
MRNVKAKLQVEPWNGSIGAKAELQMAWFRVKVVPYDKRSIETMAYVGFLVGATVEVDKTSLNRADYSRVKIAAWDISKVLEKAEWAILPYVYDFTYEREVEMDPNIEGNTILVQGGVDRNKKQSSPKNQRVGGQSSRSISLQIGGSKGIETGKDTMKGKQTLTTLMNPTFGSSSTPPKFQSRADQVKKFAYKADNGELLGDKEDRVQVLYGETIDSEDDLLSDEARDSQPTLD